MEIAVLRQQVAVQHTITCVLSVRSQLGDSPGGVRRLTATVVIDFFPSAWSLRGLLTVQLLVLASHRPGKHVWKLIRHVGRYEGARVEILQDVEPFDSMHWRALAFSTEVFIEAKLGFEPYTTRRVN